MEYLDAMKTTTVYRVTFTYLTNVAGNVVRANGSTRWFDSLKDAQNSRWAREDGAKIEARKIAA